MSKCRRCGTPTFGPLCRKCKEGGLGPAKDVFSRAREQNLEVLWSHMIGAYIVLDSDLVIRGTHDCLDSVDTYLNNLELDEAEE